MVGIAKRKYDKDLIGIVSSNPHTVMGMETASTTRVALTGRVPAIVSLESGSIKKGDRITSGTIPGVGVKARRPGYIVGHALEDWDPNSGIGICNPEISLVATTTLESTASTTENSSGDSNCRVRIMVKIETGFDMGIGDVIQDAGIAFADISAAMTELTNEAFEKGAELTKAVFGQIIAKVAVIADLFAKNIFTENITAKKLCLEDICVTKAELQALLLGVASSTPSAEVSESEPEPEPESEPSPDPPPSPDLSPPPESESESPPTPEPETTPEPTPEPVPEPESEPPSEPEPESPPESETETATESPPSPEQESPPVSDSTSSPQAES